MKQAELLAEELGNPKQICEKCQKEFVNNFLINHSTICEGCLNESIVEK